LEDPVEKRFIEICFESAREIDSCFSKMNFESSSGKHNDQMDLIAIPHGLRELIRVRGGMIDINFNDVVQFIFFGKQRLVHSRELSDELAQTFTHGIPLNGYHLQAVRKLSMSCMNVYFDRHVLLLSYYETAQKTTSNEYCHSELGSESRRERP
jgi:hypothetical protein